MFLVCEIRNYKKNTLTFVLFIMGDIYWNQWNLIFFNSQSVNCYWHKQSTVTDLNNKTTRRNVCEITNKLFPLWIWCAWLKTLNSCYLAQLKSLHCRSCHVLSVIYWVFRTIDCEACTLTCFLHKCCDFIMCYIFS